MTLKTLTDSLSRDKQFRLAIRLAKLALPVWEAYAAKKKCTYRDTIVGLKHQVDKKLLQKAIETAEKQLNENSLTGSNELVELRKQFEDPIVALQDEDWVLPDEVLKIFYAVYNLVEAFFENEQTVLEYPAIYVSINQSADALDKSEMMSVDEIKIILAAV